MSKSFFWMASAIIVISALHTPSLLAQERKVLSGEISMQLQNDKSDDPYEATKQSVLSKLTSFEQDIQAQKFTSPPTFTKEELTFLAAINLYCTLREGVCTLIPFVLYDTDFVRAISQPKPSCTNLVRYWKQWISADMEKRVGLNLRVAYFEKRNQYKKNLRPKLLHCSDTIATMLSENEDKTELLKKRYEPQGKRANLPGKLVRYIVALHKKVPNIYQETGVR